MVDNNLSANLKQRLFQFPTKDGVYLGLKTLNTDYENIKNEPLTLYTTIKNTLLETANKTVGINTSLAIEDLPYLESNLDYFLQIIKSINDTLPKIVNYINIDNIDNNLNTNIFIIALLFDIQMIISDTILNTILNIIG